MAAVLVQWEEGWGIMQEGMSKAKNIIEGEIKEAFNSEEKMNLYTIVYTMCTQVSPHSYQPQLYEAYRQSVEEYSTHVILLSIKEKHEGGEFMLQEILNKWENHKLMVKWFRLFLTYLDRFYVRRNDLPTLYQVGLNCFRSVVYEEVKGEAIDIVISLINRERQEGQFGSSRPLLKSVTDLFVIMGGYENDLEARVLEDASACYCRLASTWIHKDSCPDYMRKAEDCLDAEKDRVSTYMQSTTEQKLLDIVRHQLLYQQQSNLLEKEHSGCRQLLLNDMAGDLSTMYRLFSKVENGLDSVSMIFKEHVTAQGMALIKQAEEEQRADSALDFIRKAIGLHDKYLGYVSDCFQNHSLFHKALKEAFEVFCNKSLSGCPSAELLAAFSESILQKGGGSEKLSDDEGVEEMLDKIVKMLAYLSDKDLFSEFCRKKLSRRLLFDKTANADHERSFLAKLKQHYGGVFTSKMEGMMTDLTISREHQSNLDMYIRDNPRANPGIGLAVTTLTTGFWPSYKPSGLNLPAEMLKCIEAFTEFYEAKCKNRKLIWIQSLGSCTLIAKFRSKTMELIVTTYQATMLLLFNDSDRLSYSEIASQLNLEDNDVVRVLHSLSCAKYKILKKVPSTKSISKSDFFEFNSEFTDKLRRIRLPLPPTEERKKVIEDVNKDRKYAIDACIVRLMKSRKVLGYQQLVVDCIEQLNHMFKPDIKAIKNRIEDLIAREFLERDEENPNTFKYLA